MGLRADTFAWPNETMQISGSDIHLLSVFDSVVRNNGFSAAQAELGLSQPTISNHITALEKRIGAKLCQRGRRGFLLTEKGEIVHRIAKRLLDGLDDCSRQLTTLRGSLVGELNVAVVDCVATDENLHVPEGIRRFSEVAPAVRLRLYIEQPQDILSGLTDGVFHLGIGSFDVRLNGLVYEDLYSERHSVYCGRAHPLFALEPASLDEDWFNRFAWVHRGYWGRQRRKGVRVVEEDRVALDIEAQLLWVLSGSYLGLLPDHAAAQHLAEGRLRKLPENPHDFDCTMQLTYPTGSQPKAVTTFGEIIRDLYAA